MRAGPADHLHSDVRPPGRLLSRYRRDLERALKSLLGHDPARQEVQQQLAEAIAEQDSRTAIARSSRP